MLPGTFTGCALHSGGGRSGDLIVADCKGHGEALGRRTSTSPGASHKKWESSQFTEKTSSHVQMDLQSKQDTPLDLTVTDNCKKDDAGAEGNLETGANATTVKMITNESPLPFWLKPFGF